MVTSHLQHYGVPGMKWGVRKDRSKIKTLYRVTKTQDESQYTDGYYTTSAKEAKSFSDFVSANNSIDGVHTFLMKSKLKDVIITPSQKEEVDIQLELLRDKKIMDLWSESLATNYMAQVQMWEKHQDLYELEDNVAMIKTPEAKRNLGSKYNERLKKAEVDLKKAKLEFNKDKNDYKQTVKNRITESTNEDSLLDFQIAVFGSPELRKIYRDVMVKKGYNAVEDYWGQREQRNRGSDKFTSPSALMILDKRIIKNTKVKQLKVNGRS